MKLAVLAALLGSAAAFAPAPTGRVAYSAVSESKADLESLAADLNPAVKFFDPLNLAEAEFWGTSNEATIGFLREAVSDPSTAIKVVFQFSSERSHLMHFTSCRGILCRRSSMVV